MVQVGDRSLRLTNLDKVLYPQVGFTKAQVIDYYVRVAPTMLDHVGDRGITMRRYPDGVGAESFFNKRCPDWRPDWMQAVVGPGDDQDPIAYCRLAEVAALAWSANLAALEIHAPMARCGDIETPTMVVYDLDPGDGVGIAGCCEIALLLRELLAALDLVAFPKTSGSKGMQLYLPLNRPGHTHAQASAFARATGQMIEREHPDRVTTSMGKSHRVDKVFIDWSQNSRHKTTIAPYSLRARPDPTASTPLTWAEVESGAAQIGTGDSTGTEPGAVPELRFVADEVLERIAAHGDLFAETITVEQQLPGESG